jgi:hypothetical protein
MTGHFGYTGNEAGDPLYWPAIQQSRGVLPAAGVLYTGDIKMEALPLRGRVVGDGDHYLKMI